MTQKIESRVESYLKIIEVKINEFLPQNKCVTSATGLLKQSETDQIIDLLNHQMDVLTL